MTALLARNKIDVNRKFGSRSSNASTANKAWAVQMTIDIPMLHTDDFSIADRNGDSPNAEKLNEVLLSEEQSRALLEASRWPTGPVCIKCGASGQGCRISSRTGIWSCKTCRNCQYTVTSGTALHGTRVEISKWIALFALRRIWHEPVSAASLSRDLNISYVTARRMLQKVDELEINMPAMAARLEAKLRALV